MSFRGRNSKEENTDHNWKELTKENVAEEISNLESQLKELEEQGKAGSRDWKSINRRLIFANGLRECFEVQPPQKGGRDE